nr:hypothetical protein BaRGS_031084 [Batillaria attramentaria]
MADIDASGSDAGGKDAGSEMALTGQSKTILDMMKGLFKEFAQTTDAKIERLSQEVAARTKRDRNESDSESGVIGRVLQKVQKEGASGVLVVPDWPTQTWYPVLLRLTQAKVRLTNRRRLLLFPPRPEEIHPLISQKRLNLLVCKI